MCIHRYQSSHIDPICSHFVLKSRIITYFSVVSQINVTRKLKDRWEKVLDTGHQILKAGAEYFESQVLYTGTLFLQQHMHVHVCLYASCEGSLQFM